MVVLLWKGSFFEGQVIRVLEGFCHGEGFGALRQSQVVWSVCCEKNIINLLVLPFQKESVCPFGNIWIKRVCMSLITSISLISSHPASFLPFPPILVCWYWWWWIVRVGSWIDQVGSWIDHVVSSCVTSRVILCNFDFVWCIDQLQQLLYDFWCMVILHTPTCLKSATWGRVLVYSHSNTFFQQYWQQHVGCWQINRKLSKYYVSCSGLKLLLLIN